MEIEQVYGNLIDRLITSNDSHNGKRASNGVIIHLLGYIINFKY